MKKYYFLIPIISLILFASCNSGHLPPEPLGPVPSPAQLEWNKLEYYGFVHFNMNTFSNMEWGYGDEDPKDFNPTELDCRQWVKVMKDAGMKGVIITAKHHDGFCLWPSKYTEHSVKNAPWKDGKGDIIRELADACKAYDMKFGIYYSPWDRNHKDYGKPEYITYMYNQLTELLTEYGEIFEVWFDGANGGTGYYGGANEERRVDKKTYYDWENTYKLVYQYQPNAILFSDGGPGCRWIGNEHGYSYPTTWSMLLRDSVYAGMPEYAEKYASGQENGTHWVPGEADVSIRPGWYYHPYEDHKVRSVHDLLEIYYRSIGMNSNLLLNFPVDTRGLIHENDVAQLQKLTAKIKADFDHNLIPDSQITTSSNRGKNFNESQLTDDKLETYWVPSELDENPFIEVSFDQPIKMNRLILQENIALGQRVKEFVVSARNGDEWEPIATETTIGYKRILRLPDTETSGIRIEFSDYRGIPTISTLEIYNAPKLLIPPSVIRDKEGMVNMVSPESGVEIFYTTDGSMPDSTSLSFSAPFEMKGKGVLNAVTYAANNYSEVGVTNFDISSHLWTIQSGDKDAVKCIDGDPNTWMASEELIIDLGEKLMVRGFNYLPTQQRFITGFIEEYEFSGSMDGKNWNIQTSGTFGNILNNPTLQEVFFNASEMRFIKFKAIKTIDGNKASIAEFSVITE